MRPIFIPQNGCKSRGHVFQWIFIVSALICVGCSEESPVQVQTKPPVNGTQCFDYRDYLHTVGLIATPGQANAVAVAGDYVYVADGDNGLQIIDVHDRSQPELLGAVDTAGTALDLSWWDDIVCLAYGQAGLVIFDTQDPGAPRITGSASTPGDARGIEISDTVAYVADDVVGLMLFDISDPSAPVALGVENTPGKAVNVAVAGPLAYVADETLGLRVVNVSNPQVPWLVNTIPISGLVNDVFVTGGYAFVAAGRAGVQVVDVSTTGSETIVGLLDISNDALDVAGSGQTLYVADGSSGTRIAEIQTPWAPEEFNIIPTSSSSKGVAVSGDYVYVAEELGVRIVEAGNPSPPPLIDRLMPAGLGSVLYLDAADSLVYGIARGISLFVADLQYGTALGDRGQAPFPFGEPNGLVVKDGFVYVSTRTEGITVYDVRDPDVPVQYDYLPFASRISGLDVLEGVIYFATGGEQVGVYVMDGQHPAVYARAVAAKTTAVAADTGFVFVTGEGSELIVVNVKDAYQPFTLGRYPIEGSGEDVLVRGEYAYVVTGKTSYGGRNGVSIFDIRWSGIPILEQFVETFGKATRVAVSDNTIYVAQGVDGLEVIDVSDPLNPEKIGAFGTDYEITDIAVDNGFLLVSEGDAGIFAAWTQACASP